MTRKSPSRKARDAGNAFREAFNAGKNADAPAGPPPILEPPPPQPPIGRIDERCVGPIRILQLANGQMQFQQLYERVTYAPDGFTALEWTQEWRAVPVVVQAPA